MDHLGLNLDRLQMWAIGAKFHLAFFAPLRLLANLLPTSLATSAEYCLPILLTHQLATMARSKWLLPEHGMKGGGEGRGGKGWKEGVVTATAWASGVLHSLKLCHTSKSLSEIGVVKLLQINFCHWKLVLTKHSLCTQRYCSWWFDGWVLQSAVLHHLIISVTKRQQVHRSTRWPGPGRKQQQGAAEGWLSRPNISFE